MTASVTSKQFNNFEEMFSVVKETTEKADVVVDKAAKDFEKVFDKSVEKIKNAEEKTNESVEKVSNAKTDTANNKTDANFETNTIVEGINNLKKDSGIEKKYNDVVEDIKKIVEQCTDIDLKSALKDKISTILSNTEISEQWAEIREVLNDMVSEVNVETSLDLTLAKDINEIISQLKEAVEKTAQSLEDIENKIQPVVDLNQLEGANAEALNTVVNNSSSESEAELSVDEAVKSDNQQKFAINAPFEQVLTFYDKPVKSEIVSDEKTLDLNNNLIDAKEFEQTEIIEFAENITEELASDKTNEKVVSNDLESLLDEEMLKELKIENVQAETDTAGGDTLMQRQTPEEVAIKTMIDKDTEIFDVRVDRVQTTQTVQVNSSKPVEVNASRILEQITRQMESLQSGSKVNIVLNPESLGKVNIQLLSTKEGLMAQLTVTTQEAKDILMKGLDGLKDSLLAQGVGVDNVSVKVADAQKSEYNQDWTEQEGSRGGNKGQKNPDREEKEKGAFEKMMAQTLEKENGNV